MASVDMATFEQAALTVVQGQTSSPAFQQASSYLQQVSSLQNSYQLCVGLLASQHPQARFFALQALCQFVNSAGYAAMDHGAKIQFRRAMLEYCRAKCMSCEHASEAKYVSNKLSLLFALLLKVDYPEAWPTAFSELLSLVVACGGFNTVPSPGREGTAQTQGPSMQALCAIDMVLKILQALHSEVVDPRIHRTSAETARNMVVKDAIRLRNDVNLLADFWYTLLPAVATGIAALETSLGLTSGPGRPGSPSAPSLDSSQSLTVAVGRLCLEVMALYADWCDIKLFAHEAATRLHISLLNSCFLRTGVTRLLFALVDKGAEPATRLSLLQALELVQVTSQLTNAVEAALASPTAVEDPAPYSNTGTDDDSEFGEAVCALANVVTGVLLEAGEIGAVMANSAACAWTAASLRTSVMLLLRLLDRSSVDTGLGIAVMPTVNMLVACLQKELRPSGTGASARARSGGMSDAGAQQETSGTSSVVAGPGRPAGVSCAEFMPALLVVVARQFTHGSEDDDDARGASASSAAGTGAAGGVGVHDAGGVEEDEEDDFRSLREGLRKVFVNLVRIAPDAVLQQLSGASTAPRIGDGAAHAADPAAAAPWTGAALAALRNCSWQISERALTLLFLYGEGAGLSTESSTVGVQLRNRTGALYVALQTAIAGSGLAAAQALHPQLAIAYFELCSRYVPFLLPLSSSSKSSAGGGGGQPGSGTNGSTTDGVAMLSMVLQAMLGPCGLRHTAPTVRSRTAYLLLKLVKTTVRSHTAAASHFAQGVLQGIAEFLVVKPPQLQPLQQGGGKKPGLAQAADGSTPTRGSSGLGSVDSESLFEVAGLLLGSGGQAQGGAHAGKNGAEADLATTFQPLETRIAYTEQVLSPLLAGMDSVLGPLTASSASNNGHIGLGLAHPSSGAAQCSQGRPDITPEMAQALGGYVVRCLSAVGHVIKGFGSVAGIEPLAVLQERCLGAAMTSLLVFPAITLIPGLRPKVIFLLHRLVDTLDMRLLRSLPACLPPLLGLGLPSASMGGTASSPAATAAAAANADPVTLVPVVPLLPEDICAVFTLLLQAVGKFCAREAASLAALPGFLTAPQPCSAPEAIAQAPLLCLLNRWILALAGRVATAMPDAQNASLSASGGPTSPGLRGMQGGVSLYGPGYRRHRKMSDLALQGGDAGGQESSSAPLGAVEDDARARAELWKGWIGLMNGVAQSAAVATVVLGVGTPGANLPQLLTTLLEPINFPYAQIYSGGSSSVGGASASTATAALAGALGLPMGPDPALAKACFQTVTLLVKAWMPAKELSTKPAAVAAPGASGGVGGSPMTAFPTATPTPSTHPVRVQPLPSPLQPPVLTAFLQWLLDRCLGCTFSAAIPASFDPCDAQAASMATEAIVLQAALAVHAAAATGAPPPSTVEARMAQQPFGDGASGSTGSQGSVSSSGASQAGHGGGGGVDCITVLQAKVLPALGADAQVAAAYCARLRICLGQPKECRPQYLAVVQSIRASQAAR